MFVPKKTRPKRKMAPILGALLLLILATASVTYSGPGDTTIECSVPLSVVCDVGDPDGLARIVVTMDTAQGPVQVVQEAYSSCPQMETVFWDPIVPNFEITVEECNANTDGVAGILHGNLLLYPEGDATLDLDASDIHVNVSQGLEGGARMALHDARFFSLELDSLDLRGDYKATIMGDAATPHIELYDFTIGVDTPSQSTLLVDASAAGAESYAVTVYLQGTLNGEALEEVQTLRMGLAHQLQSLGISVHLPPEPGDVDVDCEFGDDWECCVTVDDKYGCIVLSFPATPVTIGDMVVMADRIEIVPIGAGLDTAVLSEAIVTATNDQMFTIDRASRDGKPYYEWKLEDVSFVSSALGDAELIVLGDRLFVTEIGSTGDDGMQSGTPEWKYIPIRRYGLTLQFDPQDGGLLRLRTLDPDDNPISTLAAEFQDDGLLLTPHFQAGTYTAQYWDDDGLVEEFTAIPSGTAVTPDPGLPTEPSCAQGKFETHICNLQANCWDTDGDAWCWYFAEKIVIPGTENDPQYATWLRMVADEPLPTALTGHAPAAVDALTPIAEIQLLASDIPVIALLDTELDLFHMIYLPTVLRDGTAG